MRFEPRTSAYTEAALTYLLSYEATTPENKIFQASTGFEPRIFAISVKRSNKLSHEAKTERAGHIFSCPSMSLSLFRGVRNVALLVYSIYMNLTFRKFALIW